MLQETVGLDQEVVRRKKLAALQRSGMEAFPAESKRDHSCADVVRDFTELESFKTTVTLAGRVRGLRGHGGSTFLTLEDGTGPFQVFASRDEVGAVPYALLSENADLGDFWEFTGRLFRTKRGEKTLAVKTLRILAKALRPLPEQWHGLSDVEVRYRHRELDLIANPEVRGYVEKRSALVRTLRRYLDDHGLLEVETPILQPLAGGANARPFVTYHNTLKQDFFLRIAPELYLKRLIVGGFPAVYEVARCFRNEGIDHSHNPEFTQIELYVAYRDALWMQKFFTDLLHSTIRAVTGGSVIEYEGNKIDLTPPFATVRFADAVAKYGGPKMSAADKVLAAAIRKTGGLVEKGMTRPQLLDGVLKHIVRPKLGKPTFLTHYPVELSPLAKRDPEDPTVAQHWQFFAGGLELARAFSELNDPIDQRQRFLEQEKLRTAGDEEAQKLDENYLEALAVGMPPTAGLGFGIDRLAVLLTGAHGLKEVILFPALKNKDAVASNKTARTAKKHKRA